MSARLTPLDVVPGPGRPRAGYAAALPGWVARPAPAGPFVVGLLPGEGIGPEVTAAALRVLDAVAAATGLRFDVRRGGAIGLAAHRASGAVLTPEVTGFCAEVFAAGGAVFCGPGGGRFVYDLRTRFDLYCKVVPLQPLPALQSTGPLRPEAVRDVDVLVVRENTAGIYQGEHGEECGPDGRRAWQRFGYSRPQAARLLDFAARTAAARRGELCVVTKPAGVPTISALWAEAAREAAAAHGVALRILEVDTACYQLVADARAFDVVAAPNLFGDVVADAATLLLGARGASCSANFGAGGLAVYQTGHGAAYDLAGSDRANPVGQVLSLALLLTESLGRPDLGAAVRAATDRTLRAGWRTPDVLAPGCRAVGTGELAARIADTLAGMLADPPRALAAEGGRLPG